MRAAPHDYWRSVKDDRGEVVSSYVRERFLMFKSVAVCRFTHYVASIVVFLLENIYVRPLDTMSRWQKVDGAATEVEVGPQGAVYAVNAGGDVFMRLGKCAVLFQHGLYSFSVAKYVVRISISFAAGQISHMRARTMVIVCGL